MGFESFSFRPKQEIPQTPFQLLKREYGQNPSKKLEWSRLLNAVNMDFQDEALNYLTEEHTERIKAYLNEEDPEQKKILLKDAQEALHEANQLYYKPAA